MNKDKTLISDDWTKNWNGSIAVKIAAVVLWVMIAISLGTILLLLNNIEKDLKNTSDWNGERLTAYVSELASQTPTPSIRQIKLILEKNINQFDFPAVVVKIGDNELNIGEKKEDYETHYSRELYSLYPAADGESKRITLTPYKYPIKKLIKDKRNELVISVLAALMIFGLLLTWIINLIVTKPIQALLNATQVVSQGNLDTRLEVAGDDEFSQLSNFFNQMLENLNEQQKDLKVALETAESATEAKSAFVANMSHEIRTPLTAIIGYAGLIKDSNKSLADNMGEVKTIIRNGEHLLQVINNILDLSKIEANKIEIENAPVNISEIVTDVLSIIESPVKEKALTCTVNYQYPIPKTIISEPLRIKQILLNLCSNAVKFTNTGSINIAINCDASNEKLNITITDTGIGMSTEQLERIFNAFTQADSSTTRKYGGTGLGLHLSKQLIEALDGNLSVKSELNKGSQFKITINTGSLKNIEFLTEDSIIPVRKPESDKRLPTNTVIGKVLLAEDSEDNQRLFSLYLSSMGAEVTLAENGKVAIEKAQNDDYDLILMDIQMPIMSGLEAVEYLRAQGYQKPIVALTANAMTEDRRKCFAAGCDEFISKPVNREFLYEVVSGILGKAEQVMPEKQPILQSIEKKSDAPEVINSPLVSTLYEEDPGAIDIIRKFISKLPVKLNQINVAFQKKDWEELANIIHQLKSEGGGYGYNIVTDIARKIEQDMKSKNYDDIQTSLTMLDSVYKHITEGMSQIEKPAKQASSH